MSETTSPAHSPLVVILGATATGKSQLAIELAGELDGEVVSADSRQIYRGMDIGTGKITSSERECTPHHLLDVVDPDEPYGLADYCEQARAAIDATRSRGHIPILAGGSGQYVWAIAEGWIVPRVAPDAGLRVRLLERAKADDGRSLYDDLLHVDAAAARAIDPRNIRRVIRALEIAELTGIAPSTLRARQQPPSSVLLLGLAVPRAELYRRIDLRVDRMMRDGLLEEVEGLLARGYDASLPAMSGIGYTQAVQFLRGVISFDDAVSQTKTATHRLARHQSAWFRADDSRITWLEDAAAMKPLELVRELAGGGSGVAIGSMPS